MTDGRTNVLCGKLQSFRQQYAAAAGAERGRRNHFKVSQRKMIARRKPKEVGEMVTTTKDSGLEKKEDIFLKGLI